MTKVKCHLLFYSRLALKKFSFLLVLKMIKLKQNINFKVNTFKCLIVTVLEGHIILATRSPSTLYVNDSGLNLLLLI